MPHLGDGGGVDQPALHHRRLYRAPACDLITVAKLVATAAVISHDRVHFGVGSGWCKEEFDATGQDFDTRGKRLDDMIPALRALWAGGWVEYHGPHYDVASMQINPSPGAPVPILVGGHSAAALRRAARLGDGWIGAGPYSVEETLQYVERLDGERLAAGRRDLPFAIYVAVAAPPDADLYRRLEERGRHGHDLRPVDAGQAGQGPQLPVRPRRQDPRQRRLRRRRHRQDALATRATVRIVLAALSIAGRARSPPEPGDASRSRAPLRVRLTSSSPTCTTSTPSTCPPSTSPPMRRWEAWRRTRPSGCGSWSHSSPAASSSCAP